MRESFKRLIVVKKYNKSHRSEPSSVKTIRRYAKRSITQVSLSCYELGSGCKRKTNLKCLYNNIHVEGDEK